MRKTFSFLLAATLVAFTAMPVFAASEKVVGLADDCASLGAHVEFEGFSATVGSQDYIDVGTVYANQEAVIYFYLYPEMFQWEDDAMPGSLTKAMVTGGKIGVYTKKTKGYPVLKSISLENYKDKETRGVRVEVKFIDEFVSVSEENFTYDICMTKSNVKQEQTLVTVTGTMDNPDTQVQSDTNTADTMDGMVLESQQFVKDIVLKAGSGVSVKMNLFENCRYYCKAVIDFSGDMPIVDAVPAIEGVVNMRTATSGNATFRSAVVTMDLSDVYFVYNAEGKYVGKSNEEHVFSNKYYLATAKISMDGTAS